MADEIVIEVKAPETAPEIAPVIVVPESPAPAGGTDAVVVFTLEMLSAQIAESASVIESLKADVQFLRERVDHQSERITDVEVQAIVADEIEEESEGEIVAEVIPAEIVEAIAEAKPEARKRKFI